jgi:hypothetical protein
MRAEAVAKLALEASGKMRALATMLDLLLSYVRRTWQENQHLIRSLRDPLSATAGIDIHSSQECHRDALLKNQNVLYTYLDPPEGHTGFGEYECVAGGDTAGMRPASCDHLLSKPGDGLGLTDNLSISSLRRSLEVLNVWLFDDSLLPLNFFRILHFAGLLGKDPLRGRIPVSMT